jgi:hypothetical protein
VIVSSVEVAKCMNATLLYTGAIGNVALTTSYYNATGSIIPGMSDAAYVYYVNASPALTGNMTVKDARRLQLYQIFKGNTTPIDNGGSKMCIYRNGCTVSSFVSSGDSLWKMGIKIWEKTGTNTTLFSQYQATGISSVGVPLIRWGAGSRLVFYGTPYISGMNTSLYYEGG